MTFKLARRDKVNPYRLGWESGYAGEPLQFIHGPAGERYRDGWYDGYRQALREELSEYNRRYGTAWTARV